MPTPQEVIAAVRARRSDVSDLRDAAHEAAHAIHLDLQPPWTRSDIHDDMLGRLDGELGGVRMVLESEVLARAVERLVCARLGEPLEDPDQWIAVACLEWMNTFHVDLPLARMRSLVDAAERGPQAAEIAELVIGLVAVDRVGEAP